MYHNTVSGMRRSRLPHEMWRSTQVGRRGAPAKGVGRVTGARVRISPSPPIETPIVIRTHEVWTTIGVLLFFLGI